MTMDNYLIYGANGYTGALIAREATARGHKPILAGRNAGTVATLARELGLEHRVFPLDSRTAIDEGIKGVRALLHCAGPFAHTSKPMVDACLRHSIHYLDITGEIQVFEACAARDNEAKTGNIMLMPGVGFDVVPSDCVAAHLKRRLPSATALALGFFSRGGLSRGTATTMTENIHRGGAIRRNGVLTPVPAAWKTRTIDFGAGLMQAMTIPWGDVSTAYHSTRIPNIEVYIAASKKRHFLARMSRYLGWFLGSSLAQNYFKRKIQAGPPGPTDAQRARGQCYLWGEATDDANNKVVTRLRGPEGYTFTAWTALAVVDRVLAGQAPAGFQTPAMAYGPDFVLEVHGVVREDEEITQAHPSLATTR
jgi:short subunit dehydrogenase-like uncharacterized protein